jgi:predicted amidophosphoribosyltransferase
VIEEHFFDPKECSLCGAPLAQDEVQYCAECELAMLKKIRDEFQGEQH